ncbi:MULTISPECIES: retropepsin-like aspartic protease [unclassified Pseudoalteromonas]|uniref:retropepsin-like aspartic protease n=1 Tax=unclassified Pseudoalteromonas TaxID=194690 RepID=UPI0025B316B9|nr:MULTISPECIES: retropepsin-like aspartic protease [unclassified Pseudoalteromonas]MDN3396576.1 retropepsin-like aspartic protease [Pseudoalteromonas sp. APC 3215]MDN3471716.1 retropepsin-like aspartic protease [Pseudoalteromonas sp. APC 4026]
MELVKTTSLKFEVTETGHQIIQVKINGHKVNLILDTAAGASVLDRACIKKLGIQEKLSEENAAGLGTADHEMGLIEVLKFELAGQLFESTEFVSLNLDHVQPAGGDNIIHGLLGSPFFRKYQAVLDFGTDTLTISEPLADCE